MIVAVYVVLYARLVDGVNVAVAPLVVTAPETSPPPPLNFKVLVLSVDPFISNEKVAETVVLTATPVAPLEGLADDTESVTGVGSDPDAGAGPQLVLLLLSVQLLG